MLDHIIINDEAYVYECLNCGFTSEPPWMTPPPDIAQDARDQFIAEHKHCRSRNFDSNDVEQLNPI